ncbi:MAG TPA: hypothetical protein VGN39_16330, partial [Terriglobales bacterium]|nr:hypothetical protein [Terriglobales bacterium]
MLRAGNFRTPARLGSKISGCGQLAEVAVYSEGSACPLGSKADLPGMSASAAPSGHSKQRLCPVRDVLRDPGI